MNLTAGALIPLLAAVPLLAGVLARLVRGPGAALDVLVAGSVANAGLVAAVALLCAGGAVQTAGGGWLRVDALSLLHLAIMAVVGIMTSVFAREYFGHELKSGRLDARALRRFVVLWSLTLASMAVVLTSNNLGLMWVGLEGTTVVTAFLISLHRTPRSVEATWKYILVCSVGIALAFMGTLLMAAACAKAGGSSTQPLMWTDLAAIAGALDPSTARIAFIFLLVGYGTKAGLVPMHTWLPDAHSQAPAPVSALFSGFMINAGLYCLMRYQAVMALVPEALEWSRGMLVLFGMASIFIAAAFILFQSDIKRLLAYHSVEHMGIIVLGLGLGGLGTFAALYHALNHSICKTLGFCCAGRIAQIYGTQEMEGIHGTLRRSPVWGWGLWISFLALVGVAPFSIFMSEFLVARSALSGGHLAVLAGFLGCTGLVFIAALRHAISMALGPVEGSAGTVAGGFRGRLIVGLALVPLLIFGLYLPAWLHDLIARAAGIVDGVR